VRPSTQQSRPAGAFRGFPLLGRGLALCVGCALAIPGCDGSETPEEPPPVESALQEPAPVPAPEPEATPEAAPLPPEIASLPPKYQKKYRMLESREVLMEWKHEIVLDDLAPDPSDDATTVLIFATQNDSIPVSMAGLKALANRVDDRVETQLVSLLEDDSWERRAWAARILGQTERRGALMALTEVLAHETDARVRRQIEEAVTALDAVPAKAEASEAVEATGAGRGSDGVEPGEAGG